MNSIGLGPRKQGRGVSAEMTRHLEIRRARRNPNCTVPGDTRKCPEISGGFGKPGREGMLLHPFEVRRLLLGRKWLRLTRPRRCRYISCSGFLQRPSESRATITVISSACSDEPLHFSAALNIASAMTCGEDSRQRMTAPAKRSAPKASPDTFSGSISPSL